MKKDSKPYTARNSAKFVPWPWYVKKKGSFQVHPRYKRK